MIDRIIHWKPYTFASLYLGNIIIFSLVYYYFLDSEFSKPEHINFLQTLYFSIVTVTTLGYGDITPELTSDSLLITIIIQVSTGILFIGLFLNSLAQKLSDLRDEAVKKQKDADAKELLTKQMALLKPIIEDHLKILSRVYTVTTNKRGKNYQEERKT